jgi:hypothetical protein
VSNLLYLNRAGHGGNASTLLRLARKPHFVTSAVFIHSIRVVKDILKVTELFMEPDLRQYTVIIVL